MNVHTVYLKACAEIYLYLFTNMVSHWIVDKFWNIFQTFTYYKEKQCFQKETSVLNPGSEMQRHILQILTAVPSTSHIHCMSVVEHKFY